MSARLTIGLSDAFAERLALKISTADVRLVDAVEQLLTETFIRNHGPTTIIALPE
ncbi:hypothetical protein GR268_20705 [Rhizobium leguminosarum]|uniref:hypothetical protein n=1 Tax=Rhizobium TaxID=379 RepID=UPI00032220F2|nr:MULTISPECIES: hypothetical protein [Rhizobium]MBY3249899.1 hypothetical protein [Rhizobium laguerreae]NEJ79111.1 hypothetical protein [Rhizobium leguminosarum]